MNRQRTTPASLTSSAANSKQKGLQQYFTPQNWALAIGAALPPHRRTLFDPFCGNGSFVRGLANDTTRDVMGLDLDPSATLGKETAWAKTTAANARRHFAHGDVLDLLPLLEETGTKFDLMALNPPFSLEFPLKLLPEPLRAGIKGKAINSTHLAVRMATRYLPTRGECVLIANASTIQRLQYSWPDDFSNCWAIVNVPSFFPGTDPALKIAIACFSAHQRKGDLQPYDLPITTPEELAAELQLVRNRHHFGICIDEPFHQQTDTHSAFDHCVDEMDRRRNPSHSNANIILDDHGRLRTWVSGYQQRSLKIPHHLTDFLRRITRTYPAELTIQPATRAALRETLDSGIWTIDPAAAAAISAALDDFSRDRAPLAPLNLIQRIGWLDENETILCVEDFQCFRAGQEYKLSSQTVEWKKTALRPRYRSGVRDEEEILTKGTDLQLTIHKGLHQHHFTYCPAITKNNPPGRDADISQLGGGNHHTLEDLAAHFYIPEVPDITATFPEQFQANLALLDELETITP